MLVTSAFLCKFLIIILYLLYVVVEIYNILLYEHIPAHHWFGAFCHDAIILFNKLRPNSTEDLIIIDKKLRHINI